MHTRFKDELIFLWAIRRDMDLRGRTSVELDAPPRVAGMRERFAHQALTEEVGLLTVNDSASRQAFVDRMSDGDARIAKWLAEQIDENVWAALEEREERRASILTGEYFDSDKHGILPPKKEVESASEQPAIA